MTTGQQPDGLKLTEEEAFALLSLCLTSPQGLDATSERALRKLAEFCSTTSNHIGNHSLVEPPSVLRRELDRAGA
jgi:hypothetical protein